MHGRPTGRYNGLGFEHDEPTNETFVLSDVDDAVDVDDNYNDDDYNDDNEVMVWLCWFSSSVMMMMMMIVVVVMTITMTMTIDDDDDGTQRERSARRRTNCERQGNDSWGACSAEPPRDRWRRPTGGWQTRRRRRQRAIGFEWLRGYTVGGRAGIRSTGPIPLAEQSRDIATGG